MTDTHSRVHPPDDGPQRPPSGPAGVSPPSVPTWTVAPELLERLDRLVAAFESFAAAIQPDGADTIPMPVEMQYCGAPIFHRGARVDALPLVCTRLVGHDPGHVAHDQDGTVIVCELGRPGDTTGFVCPACGEGAEVNGA